MTRHSRRDQRIKNPTDSQVECVNAVAIAGAPNRSKPYAAKYHAGSISHHASKNCRSARGSTKPGQLQAGATRMGGDTFWLRAPRGSLNPTRRFGSRASIEISITRRGAAMMSSHGVDAHNLPATSGGAQGIPHKRSISCNRCTRPCGRIRGSSK
jgi:hypothetical protein